MVPPIDSPTLSRTHETVGVGTAVSVSNNNNKKKGEQDTIPNQDVHVKGDLSNKIRASEVRVSEIRVKERLG